MIQELTIKNFRSVRDEATLSFEATDGGRNECVVVMPDGVRLLRFVLLMGANASGKSNVLEALEWLRKFWTQTRMTADEGTDVVPFVMQQDAWNKPTELTMCFYVDGLRYRYNVVVDSELVRREQMWVYVTNRPTSVFVREVKDGCPVVTINPAVAKLSATELEAVRVSCLKNMSLLAALGKVNVRIPYADNVRGWAARSMLPMMTHDTRLSDYTKSMLTRNADFKQYLLRFAREADFNISDISVSAGEVAFRHKVETGCGMVEFVLPESMQSDGTTRMIEMETIVYNLLRTQGVMAIDEIEASMHPRLINFMLTRFLAERENRSQMVVTTHYDPILDDVDDLFGKDSVWFTEKQQDGATSLFALVEFKGLGKLKSIRAAYNGGMFGAKPRVFV